MRVVLDTNVLLSALISPHGPPDRIYHAWRAARFEIITAALQLDEIRRASRYPKFRTILQPHLVGAMVKNLQRAEILDRLEHTGELNDPNDVFLVGLAVTGKADFLITGDRRAGLLDMKTIGRARIMTPAEFCATVLD